MDNHETYTNPKPVHAPTDSDASVYGIRPADADDAWWAEHKRVVDFAREHSKKQGGN